jgi:hypothetical protein
MDRTKVVQAAWRGEAVEARTELRRRRRMRPFVLLAAVFGVVIAATDFIEGNTGPAIALTLLALVLVWQWWRTPRLLERLEQAERRNAALAGEDPGLPADAAEDL